ncbi:MAG: endoribonuclease MazF [Candidatus Omnitrophica bacterium]|nr:endoribonuclease MazF [Candidatus Omnitrophota bacterium]
MPQTYCPERGDVVWISFSPQSGHEQAGHRPALVLTPKAYNRKTGVAVFCPITTKAKGYSFEVVIPPGHEISGVVLSDHLKSLDWRGRRAHFCCVMPAGLVDDVTQQIGVLLQAKISRDVQ